MPYLFQAAWGVRKGEDTHHPNQSTGEKEEENKKGEATIKGGT